MLVPVALAAPGLLGYGRQTALEILGGVIGGISVLHHGLVLPIEVARDAGYALLLGHVLLLGGAGLASAALLRTLDLAPAALVGGVLYELACVSGGVAGWRGLAALLVCPMFLGALERAIRGVRPSVLRLAVSISLVASVNSANAVRMVLAFGVAWACLRLASRDRLHRGRVIFRLAAASVLGVVLAAPLLLPRLVAGVLDVGLPLGGMPSWAGWWRYRPPDREAVGLTIVALLPVVGLASLAAVPVARRGRGLRLLLASFPAAVTVLAFVPGASGVDFAGSRPLFLTCLVTLCCVSLAEDASVRPAVVVSLAVLLLLGGLVVRPGAGSMLAIGDVVALPASLALAMGRRGWQAAVPALASAAWSAFAAAT